MVDKHEVFDEVYNKLVQTIENKISNIGKLREFGSIINYNTIKKLNLYIRYLENVKLSKDKYIYIGGLTNIKLYLNKL